MARSKTKAATIIAGSPWASPIVHRRTRFNCHDTVVLIELRGKGTFAIMREIEIARAKKARAADHIHAPKDFAPPGGLSGDRETANAQAAAELLRRNGVEEAWADRSLPMIYVHYAAQAGVTIQCDPEMGVLERRAKDDREVEALTSAQRVTERAVVMACETIARAEAASDGVLLSGGAPLTSERVIALINIFLLENGMGPSDSIVAGGPQGGDCHNRGSGPLRTGQPVIVDIFPRDPNTLYCGDCTRTVVHGSAADLPETVEKMHAAVVEAKRAAVGATRAGATGEAVHNAACDVFRARGYAIGLPKASDPPSYTGYVHGTGHGVGLEVHEPPLLDVGGPPLVAGDAITIEPGLYSLAVGGVRVEDMVIVREGGCENLNTIQEGLTWA